MKKLLYLMTLVFFICCNQKTPKDQQISKLRESKYKNLLIKYKDITFDTLNVFSAEDLENDTYKFKGKHLDSVDIALFPPDFSEQYVNDNGYFACYKFSIDTNKIGLITRTPSTYAPSSIKLLILDKEQDTIIDFIELAESFGDAGDMAEKTSWLFKDNNKKYRVFMRVEESHDNSVDNEKDTTILQWNYYYLFGFAKSKVDTLSKDKKKLQNKFESLIRRQTIH